jgi:two-component system response regulator ResD
MPSPSDKTSADPAARTATVLVVDDEPTIVEIVGRYMERAGFETYTAPDGYKALDAATEHRPDLVVLDVMLPGIDGIEVMERLQERSGPPIAVILLTARGEESDRLVGLRHGADDYVVKPFSPAELVARVKAVLRRSDGGTAPEVVQAGPVTVDVGRREVLVDDVVVDFTTKEFDLLRFLAERPGLALSRQQILDGVWGYDWFGDARTVDVHIAQVRKKLGDRVVITTVRGVGYRLEAER